MKLYFTHDGNWFQTTEDGTMKRPEICSKKIWNKFTDFQKKIYVGLLCDFVEELSNLAANFNWTTAHNLACLSAWQWDRGGDHKCQQKAKRNTTSCKRSRTASKRKASARKKRKST